MAQGEERAGQRAPVLPLLSTVTLNREGETQPRKFVRVDGAREMSYQNTRRLFQRGLLLAQGFWMLHFLKKCEFFSIYF